MRFHLRYIVLFISLSLFVLVEFAWAEAPPAVPTMPTVPTLPAGVPTTVPGFPSVPGGLPASPPAAPPVDPTLAGKSADLSKISPPKAGGDESKGMAEKLFKDGASDGNLFPALYYNNPMGVSIALARYFPDKEQRDFHNFYAQADLSLKSVFLAGGLVEVSPTGFAYSAGAFTGPVFADTNDTPDMKKGMYVGVQGSLMFALAVLRLQYYYNAVAFGGGASGFGKGCNGTFAIGIGIGLF